MLPVCPQCGRVIPQIRVLFNMHQSLSPVRGSYSQPRPFESAPPVICPPCGRVILKIQFDGNQLKRFVPCAGSYSTETSQPCNPLSLFPARGSYSQITELRAEKEQFVPHAGELFCYASIWVIRRVSLSPVWWSYSKHEQASSSCRVVCPTYGGVILHVSVLSQS